MKKHICRTFLFFGFIFSPGLCLAEEGKNDSPLRQFAQYVTIDGENSLKKELLRTPSTPVSFPLSQEDQEVIDQLKFQVSMEQNCGGLAANQIGYRQRIIVFNVPNYAVGRRDSIENAYPLTTLINPTYTPIGSEKVRDWEACFSVLHTFGEVPRYLSIEYSGLDESGHPFEGKAIGFLARLIQHEIGHLNGELFTDLVEVGCRYGSLTNMQDIRVRNDVHEQVDAQRR